MLKFFHKIKAQSVGEYTVMVSIAILAIVAMTYFIQRVFSARINDARGYMLQTLDADIKDIHVSRGGKAYTEVLAEYEPYYINKMSDLEPSSQSVLTLNGTAGTYVLKTQSLTLMNSVSTENPAQDDDFMPSGSLINTSMQTNPN